MTRMERHAEPPQASGGASRESVTPARPPSRNEIYEALKRLKRIPSRLSGANVGARRKVKTEETYMAMSSIVSPPATEKVSDHRRPEECAYMEMAPQHGRREGGIPVKRADFAWNESVNRDPADGPSTAGAAECDPQSRCYADYDHLPDPVPVDGENYVAGSIGRTTSDPPRDDDAGRPSDAAGPHDRSAGETSRDVRRRRCGGECETDSGHGTLRLSGLPPPPPWLLYGDAFGARTNTRSACRYRTPAVDCGRHGGGVIERNVRRDRVDSVGPGETCYVKALRLKVYELECSVNRQDRRLESLERRFETLQRRAPPPVNETQRRGTASAGRAEKKVRRRGLLSCVHW